MPGLGPEGGWLLSLFGAHVSQAFGHTAYQVGTSLTNKRDFRDVDVRLMLPDSEYESYFGTPQTDRHDEPKLKVWNLAWTALGKQMTGLPIDFQFQHTTLANEEFKEMRSALLITDRDLPFAVTSTGPQPPTCACGAGCEDDACTEQAHATGSQRDA